MQFQKITSKNITTVSKYLQNPEKFCDCTAVALFLWADYFNIQFSVTDGILFLKSNLPDEQDATVFFPPVDNVEKGMKILKAYCNSLQIALRLSPVGQWYLNSKNVPPFDPNSLQKLDDWSDYLYDIKDFATLKGRKFNSKRNHVNKFTSTYDFKFLSFCQKNASDVLDFLNSMPMSDNTLHDYELAGAKKLVESFQLFNLTGGVLYVQNSIVGVTLAEAMGDTLFVHVEKADRSFSGVYETLAHLFAKQNADNFAFLNREEDLGIEGLRRAKQSWHPVKLLDKYALKID